MERPAERIFMSARLLRGVSANPVPVMPVCFPAAHSGGCQAANLAVDKRMAGTGLSSIKGNFLTFLINNL
jgi:hypothetical protein